MKRIFTTVLGIIILGLFAPSLHAGQQEANFLGNLPLKFFIENKGQLLNQDGFSVKDVDYYTRRGNLEVFLRGNKISYVLRTVEREEEISEASGVSSHGKDRVKTFRVDLDLIGANAGEIKTEGRRDDPVYYYNSGVPNGVKTSHYEKVIYENIYPEIDLVYYFDNSGNFKYDFVIHPGGDPQKIQIKYTGPDNISIKDRSLLIKTALGEIVENPPVAFDENGNTVEVNYSLVNDVMTFNTGDYLTDYKLIIDPKLSWSTYFGGSGADFGRDVSTDLNGNVLVTGYTTSLNFPLFGTNLQTTLGGNNDAVIVKLNSEGTPQWTTYYGGLDEERGEGIFPDLSGNVIVTGYTESLNLPVISTAYQSSLSLLKDAFIIKLSSTGTRIWDTYYGGTSDDYGYDVATDAAQNIYVTGNSESSNLPGASNSSNGGADVFISKFSASGNLIWAKYHGGSQGDEARSIFPDINGKLYITGVTASSDFTVSSGAFQTTLSGTSDAFLMKYDSSGGMVWSTYYGGSGREFGYGVAADLSNGIYGTGMTSTNSGLPVKSAYQSSYGGGTSDAYIFKFDTAGTLQWATYYGGSDVEEGQGIIWGIDKSCYITGYTKSSNFPVTSDAYQSSKNTDEDAFLVEFREAGTREYSTYFGGNNSDFGRAITTDFLGNVIFSGSTFSSNYPTKNGYYTSNQGNVDIFITKFCIEVYNNIIASNQSICAGDTPAVIIGQLPTGPGAYVYRWEQRISGAAFQEISGATGRNFQPGPIFETTVFRRIIVNGECSDTSNRVVIRVGNQAEADFSVSNACEMDTTFFTDESTATGGDSIVFWEWDFGDGSSSLEQNPAHIYSSEGTYHVTLVIISSSGCSDTVSKNISIGVTPEADFTFPYECVGETVNFTNKSTISSGATLRYQWYFGDGSTSTQTNPSHVYTKGGSYVVTLIAKGPTGCKDKEVKTIFISPQANFTHSSGCGGKTIDFTDQSKTLTGTIISWRYRFGDGSSSNQQNPTHTYATTGNYDVTLRVETSRGCVDSFTKTITVDQGPTANFNVSDVCLGDTARFTDASSGNIVSYNYDFGDGNSSTDQNPKHVYVTTGTYTVTLVITTNLGCKDTVLKNVVVRPKPNAAFTASSTNVCVGTTINFTNNSTSPGTSIVSYQWFFGDGFVSTQTNPSYSYSSGGLYTVTLVVTAKNGCIDTSNMDIRVSPTADFTAPATCLGDTTFFTNQSSTFSGTINSYQYDFGDGNSSTQPSPAHLYASTGSYQVSLVVGTTTGCFDTLTKTVIVDGGPVADFNFSNNCAGDFTSFFSQSTTNFGTIVQYEWDFDNGKTSTAKNPNVKFTSTGNYNVKLIVTNSNGCRDSVTKTITINPKPVADFTFNAQCPGQSTSFTNKSTISAGTITSYLWMFGDGTTSNATNPTHSYTKGGFFKVQLIATSNTGCSDTSTQTVIVSPVARFAVSSTCGDDSTYFTDQSFVANDSIITYSWAFGDGNTSSAKNPVHAYATTGNFNVTFIITTQNGCSDTSRRTITVGAKPVAAFQTGLACAGKGTVFNDQSSITNGTIVSWNWTFGDGSGSFSQNPAHTYSATGTYNVTLIVTSKLGCKDTLSKTVTVYPTPNASFTVDIGCPDELTEFTNKSSISSGGSIASYNWNFGDGNTSTVKSPNHTYDAGGFYDVILTATSAQGCEDTAHKQVIIEPIADFSATNECLGNPTEFTDNSLAPNGVITGRSWDFGDGTFSTGTNPVHTYKSAGIFTVTLVVEMANGCKDTAIQNIRVFQGAKADFVTSNECSGENTQFTSTSSSNFGTINSWKWNFGNGQTSSQENPVVKYNTIDTFNVTLIVGTTDGCGDTVTKEVIIGPDPLADFTFDTVCAGTATKFTDLSSISTGNIAGWFWRFGDGTTSTQQNPTHLYPSGGIYNVTLIVQSVNGCSDTIVKPVRVDPVADFTANLACKNSPTQFTDQSSTTTGTINSWSWEFGDGGTSTSQNPVHTYNQAGDYNVLLVITTTTGCTDSVIKNVNVDRGPTADFIIANNCLGDITAFRDRSTSGLGKITGWNWDFGNGQTSTAQNPNVKYNSAGTYQVTLVITTTSGCIDTAIKDVTIAPKPVANFNFTIACPGSPTTFKDLSTISAGTIGSWFWDFGDGRTSSLKNPSHSFRSGGIYTVTLVVTSNSGCTDTIQKSVTISPMAEFSYSGKCLGGTVTFKDQSFSSNGAINKWNWNFGNGQTSTQQNPVATYSSAGRYNVRLIVTTTNNCRDTITKSIFIAPNPTADFIVTNTCAGSVTGFKDRSTAPGDTIVTWSWDFGNGQTSSARNPNIMYTTAGTYNIMLAITTVGGCSDTVIKQVVIGPTPTADFSVNTGCPDAATVFTDNSTVSSGSIVTWNWDFGDGSTSNNQNPTHSYDRGGVYQVRLIVTSTSGCSDTLIKTITVNPRADFGFTNNCSGKSVLFTDQSSSSTGSITSWSWDFGDGNSSTQQNPMHAYSAPGTYFVTLVVTNSTNCKDTVVKSVRIFPSPTADFAVTNPCLGSDVMFTDQSVSPSGNIVSWNWDFGNSKTSTQQNPRVSYTTPGAYSVMLIIESSTGCKDTITKTIDINPAPTADFAFDTACFGQSVSFTDKSTPPFGGTITVWNWSFGDGQTSTVQNPGVVYGQGGNFNVTLIAETPAGCKDTVTKTVFQPSEITVALVSKQDVQCGNDTDGSLTVQAAGGMGSYTYNWKTTPPQTGPTASNLGYGDYVVEVTDGFGCVVEETFSVGGPEPIIFNMQDTMPLCEGTQLQLDAQTFGGTAPYQYSWSCDKADCKLSATDIENPTADNVDEDVTYYLTVTDANGCKFSDSIFVKMASNPTVEAGADVRVTSNAGAQLNAVATPSNVTYSWIPISGLNDPSIANPVANPDNNTKYVVTVTTPEGCTASDSLTVIVSLMLEIPSAFTPNNDGANDIWEIRNIDLYPDVHVEIFTRWGRPVFESDGYKEPWDGTYNGKNVPVGTYYYVINLNNGEESITGTVSILK